MNPEDQISRFATMRNRSTLREGRNDWYRIENRSGGATELYIYDEIGYFGVTASDLIADLKAHDASRITVRINSPGGEVFDGIAILNALRRHPGGVDVIVDGMAASAASVIAMAGETITMARQSQMMIHEGHAMAIGPASVMRDLADHLDKTSQQLAEVYATKAGGTPDKWREAMKAGDGRGTTYTAAEAVEAGLADRIEGDGVKASWDLSLFAKIDRELPPIEPAAPALPATEQHVDIQPASIRNMLREAFSG